MLALTNGLCGSMGLVLFLWSTLGAAQIQGFAGGTGEPNDPYQIATAEQLISIGSDPHLLDKHYILLNDIDLDPNLPGGHVFLQAVIAPSEFARSDFARIAFTGSFDGCGHKVRHLTIYHDIATYQALFGSVGQGGVVKDLEIEDAHVGDVAGEFHAVLVAGNKGRIIRCCAEGHVSGSDVVGILAGRNWGEIIGCWAAGEAVGSDAVGILAGQNEGEITRCWAAGEAIGSRNVGGLVGQNIEGVIVDSHAASEVHTTGPYQSCGGGLVGASFPGVIVNCWAAGNVSATVGEYLGGLVGENSGGVISHCYATGNVSVQKGGGATRAGNPHGSLGGLVGYSDGGIIRACHASGNIFGGDDSGMLGGLVGQCYGGYIADSYAVGHVSASKNSKSLGGLAGYHHGETEACFWDIETSGLSTSSGGTGLTTAQMQDAATFLTAGWDWVDEQAHGTADLWFIPEGGGYPQLTVHSTAYQSRKLEGSGTPDDPYRIATAEDLGAVNHYDPAACYKLEADIDLAGIAWDEAPISYLGGQFDGAGRTVIGLKVRGKRMGLFGDLGQNALVVNLGIHDANLAGSGGVSGMLAGMNRGRVAGCRADGAVADSGVTGGLIGWNEGSISNSYAIGAVTDRYTSGIGGLAGVNLGAISRCYAAAYVSATGSGVGYENVKGGLVGVNQFLDTTGEIHDSYFLSNTDGGGPDNGLGIALRDVQMKQQASFANWNFENTWMICEGKDYPRLRWENVTCDQP